MNDDEIAQALEQDMNHYLTVVDRQYYRDFSRMLFSLGPMGTEFRKVYWCPIRKRPVSEWVKGKNLIVSNDAADLSTAGRVTEKIMMRHATVKRLQLNGWWRNVELSQPNPQPSQLDAKEASVVGISLGQSISADFRHTIYECYADLDLIGYEHEEDGEKTGLPLPYRITIDKDSQKILEIRRNWKEEDPNFISRKRYVMYGMIPGLGFYYLGYVHVLGNTQRALTALERLLIDSGQFSSFPGFLYKKGAIQNDTNQVRVPPGGGKEINTGDQPINSVIMPLPYKDVSAGLMQLWETIASDGRKLSSIAEMPVGEGRADVPVGTVVAMIEQTTKVMSAVHKGLHASMQEELLLLKEQFAEDPTALWAFAKTPARKWEQSEEFSNIDLVPASDPNIPSQLHRTMQSLAVFQIAQQAAPLGMINLKEVLERVFKTLNVSNVQALFTNPTQMPQPPGKDAPAPPDPLKAQELQLKQQEQQRKAAAELTQAQQREHDLNARLASDAADREAKLKIADINASATMAKIHADQNKHILGLAADLHQHHSQLTQDDVESKRAAEAAAKKPTGE